MGVQRRDESPVRRDPDPCRDEFAATVDIDVEVRVDVQRGALASERRETECLEARPQGRPYWRARERGLSARREDAPRRAGPHRGSRSRTGRSCRSRVPRGEARRGKARGAPTSGVRNRGVCHLFSERSSAVRAAPAGTEQPTTRRATLRLPLRQHLRAAAEDDHRHRCDGDRQRLEDVRIVAHDPPPSVEASRTVRSVTGPSVVSWGMWAAAYASSSSRVSRSISAAARSSSRARFACKSSLTSSWAASTILRTSASTVRWVCSESRSHPAGRDRSPRPGGQPPGRSRRSCPNARPSAGRSP